MTRSPSTVPATLALTAGLALGLASLTGCGDPLAPGWEVLPDMAHSIPYDTFAPNPVTGHTLRAPAPGTVPRGHLPFPYRPGPEEAERAGRELVQPLAATTAHLERGEVLFETFCQVCHGPTGAGDGPMVPPFPRPPAYTSRTVRDRPAGYLYHVVTHGLGRMPPYAAQLPPQERWKVVLWVQVLQRSAGSIPEGDR